MGGIVLYLRGRRGTVLGRVAFWSLVVVSTVMRAAGPWSPPPPSERAFAQFALIGWIVLPSAALADRHYRATVGYPGREPPSSVAPGGPLVVLGWCADVLGRTVRPLE